MEHFRRCFAFLMILLLCASVTFTGCANNMTPVNPTPGTDPAKQLGEEVKVVYNYGDTGKVELSNESVTLKVGQRLILEPAPGLTKTTRFTSSGDTFIGDLLKQEDDKQGGRAVFTAVKPGKGKIMVIPNTTETDRATDLWITVQ